MVTSATRSQLRHRPTGAATQVMPIASRQSRQPAPQTTQTRRPVEIDEALLNDLSKHSYRRYVRQHWQADTTEDVDLTRIPSREPRTTRPPVSQPAPQKRHLHPLVYIGGTLISLAGLWWCTTTAAGWLTHHVIDPGQYGPAHGQVVHGVFGGGDNQAHPSTVYSTNDSGHVYIVKITAGDPAKAQIIPGPDLRKIEFPESADAEIQIEVGDFDHDGHEDLKVTINSTSFDLPFHRYSQEIVLYGDGKGGLKQRTAAE